MNKIFLYITIGFAILAIPVTVYISGQNQDTRKRAAPASTLGFSPSSLSVKAGERFTLSVKLDTAANQVGLVQLRIIYDPQYLEAEDLSNDLFAPSIRVSKKIDPSGKASITVGAKDSTHPINGSGTVAVLSMKALKASVAPVLIKFSPAPDTVANALNESATDVLIGRSQASVTIKNADGSAATSVATPTPTPQVSKSITPTPTQKPTSSLPLTPTSGDAASTSAVQITSISDDELVATSSPIIKGKGKPGSTVTIILHSDTEQTAIVTVDANGNWSYTPTTPLEPGDHTVQAMSVDPNTGATLSDSTAFVVASGNETADATSGSAIPVSGSVTPTLLFIVLGSIFLLAGIGAQLLLQ